MVSDSKKGLSSLTFLRVIEAMLAVQNAAVAVGIQVAHGKEGGSQAPGEAGVPSGS